MYNIGGGSRVSINTVLDLIGQCTGQDLDIRYLPAQKGDVLDTFADTSLARAGLGFDPQVRLYEGLEYERRWLSSQGT